MGKHFEAAGFGGAAFGGACEFAHGLAPVTAAAAPAPDAFELRAASQSAASAVDGRTIAREGPPAPEISKLEVFRELSGAGRLSLQGAETPALFVCAKFEFLSEEVVQRWFTFVLKVALLITPSASCASRRA
jgi:hypothetical protein